MTTLEGKGSTINDLGGARRKKRKWIYFFPRECLLRIINLRTHCTSFITLYSPAPALMNSLNSCFNISPVYVPNFKICFGMMQLRSVTGIVHPAEIKEKDDNGNH